MSRRGTLFSFRKTLIINTQHMSHVERVMSHMQRNDSVSPCCHSAWTLGQIKLVARGMWGPTQLGAG